jgi:hypothetical protein
MTPEELLFGVKNIFNNFYSGKNSIKRVARGIRLGFYPFVLIFERNFASSMSHRRLLHSKTIKLDL